MHPTGLPFFKRTFVVCLAAVISLAVSACGGGDSGKSAAPATPPPPPAASAPTITTQPANQIVIVGATAKFSVIATGTAPLTYQWRKNSSDIAGATAASYTTPPVSASDDAATFSVAVSNSAGSVRSNSATMTVQPAGSGAAITNQPRDVTVTEGQPASFAVTASGTPAPTFFWQRSSDGRAWLPIQGATNATYTFTAQILDDGAQFRAVATNAGGTATSQAALLAVYPPAGNPAGHDAVPAAAQAEDVSAADHVVGTGTPESCTADAFIAAVALGGKITFNGGKQPFTIVLDRPAKVFNDKPDVVIDGGGLVTLSGGGATRILYMNTCDQNQVWTTSHCDNQDHPHLAVQNLTFIDGNSKNVIDADNDGGGGAIWVRGGRFKIVNCRFISNVCAVSGPDVGGAAVRVFSQYQGLPVYVVNSTFGGGPTHGNLGSNGGGISSIGVSWAIYNSVFSYNHAIGNGGNPASSGTPGGGSGGAIYMDGNTITLSLYGTLIEENDVNAYGAAIFLISNNHTGTLHIENSTVRNNHGGSWYELPGISMFADTKQEIINSTIE